MQKIKIDFFSPPREIILKMYLQGLLKQGAESMSFIKELF